MGRLKWAVLAIAVGVPALGGQAHAATTLGETFVPDACAANTTYIQTADPGSRYQVPFDGVITRWSYQTGATAPDVVQLKIGSVASGADLSGHVPVTIVAQSAEESPVAGTLNTFDTRVPVNAGQRIGDYMEGGSTTCSRHDTDYTMHYFNADVMPGATEIFTREQYQLDLSAVLESDVDRDGFGDETQDRCPANAALQEPPCDRTPPETTITKDVARSETGKVNFRFASNEPATFECKLKGPDLKRKLRQFSDCGSPRKYKNLDEGRFKFKVRAVDAAGLVDPTPAKDRFRVVD